jgi:hypothetical protein
VSVRRYWVLLVSLTIAFSLSAIFAFVVKEDHCAQEMYAQYDNNAQYHNVSTSLISECLKDAKAEPSFENTLGFSVLSSVLQMFYDTYAKFMVTCGCVQRCPTCIKTCAEGLGKIAFWTLAFLALVYLSLGAGFIAQMGGDVVASLLMFLFTRLFNFLFLTSATLLVTFYLARKAQMKPPASTLATPEGKAKWEEPKAFLPCLKKVKPCELWDTYVGADKTFELLPVKTPDYDWDLKISWCVICVTRTVYQYKAKNPMADVESPAATGPGELPVQLKTDK